MTFQLKIKLLFNDCDKYIKWQQTFYIYRAISSIKHNAEFIYIYTSKVVCSRCIYNEILMHRNQRIMILNCSLTLTLNRGRLSIQHSPSEFGIVYLEVHGNLINVAGTFLLSDQPQVALQYPYFHRDVHQAQLQKNQQWTAKRLRKGKQQQRLY